MIWALHKLKQLNQIDQIVIKIESKTTTEIMIE